MHAQGNGSACRRFHRALACQAATALPGARGLAAAAEHFARSDDMPAFASALRSGVSEEGAEAELDLFTARAVLQVLRNPSACEASHYCQGLCQQACASHVSAAWLVRS
jgi:hypothetical protein